MTTRHVKVINSKLLISVLCVVITQYLLRVSNDPLISQARAFLNLVAEIE